MSGRNGVRNWWWAGIGLVGVGWLLLIIVQPVVGDWMPPDISFSQYGVGSYGWMLSGYLIGMALGSLCLDRAIPSGRVTTAVLVIGTLGCLLMAFVRTDPGGLQQSAQAKVHMVGSFVGLTGIPIGACLSAVRSGRIARAWPLTVLGISAFSLVLLLISATGVDTLGVGSNTSWAYWQTAAMLADSVLTMLTMIVAGRAVRESDHSRSRNSLNADSPV